LHYFFFVKDDTFGDSSEREWLHYSRDGWGWKRMVMGVICDGHFAFRAKRGELVGRGGERGTGCGCWCV